MAYEEAAIPHATGAGSEHVVPGAAGDVGSVMSGLVAAISGVAPHVLHHVGPLAGTALLAGTGGTVLFGMAGFALSIPMLLRLRRRFGTWLAPAVASAIFLGVYLFSSLVVGPAITGASATEPAWRRHRRRCPPITRSITDRRPLRRCSDRGCPPSG